MRGYEVVRHIESVISVTSGAKKPDILSTADDNALIAGARPDSDLIERSWKRCVSEYGLDPSQAQPARIIESAQLREHQERSEGFLRVARGGLEQLYKRVAPLGYVLLLTDAAGVTVDYIGNDTWDRDLRRSGLYLGSDWNEAHAGTCAVGTCIVERVPLTCHRAEHFDSTHIGLTCSAAPLFDPTGEFMGVLDVSALTSPETRESQHLALHITKMFGQMIEDANFLRHFNDHWILRLGKDWTLVDVSGEYMIAFNRDGAIAGANSHARRELAARSDGGEVQTMVGHHLSEIFKLSMDDIWRVANSVSASERATVTTRHQTLLYATMTPPRRKSNSYSESRDALRSESAPVKHFPALDGLAGRDKQMERLIEQAKRLVDKRLNIILHGETGTGKEIVARALHDSSERSKKPLVAVNCAAIPETLIESELFGYLPGSFTGARSKGMRGLILQSDGGTLFLDEIGDMPLQLQTRLLRVISEREVVPIGADKPIPVDLTIIAASHRDLRRLIADNVFREDLYYRLCGATLHLPPLRARTDKEFLIHRLLQLELGDAADQVFISADALQRMNSYSWPGNIRELRNALRFALAICDDRQIQTANLPPELQEFDATECAAQNPSVEHSQSQPNSSFEASEASPESAQITAALSRNHWNITAAARELRICRATVYRHMKRLNIVPPNHQ